MRTEELCDVWVETAASVPDVLDDQVTDVPGSFAGHIDFVRNDHISGWLVAASSDAIPFVTVAGKAATPVSIRAPRPDISEGMGIGGNAGFVFSAGRVRPGHAVELYALTPSGLTFVHRRIATTPHVEHNFLSQLANAARIARMPDAVAVVCWDGAHNPIGRAKVLYEVAATRRPTVLLTYLFDEFGGRLWTPIHSADVEIVAIPWRERHQYHRALRLAGLEFDTVWLCKARLPSFELARAVAAPDAKLILDYDDNEEHFSRSPNARDKPFGGAALNLARRLANAVTSRTAASATLRDEFGAELLRHARKEDIGDSGAAYATGTIRIGFIGTVRAHKGILDAARAVRLFKYNTGRDVELHVYGDVQPKELAEELTESGAVVVQDVPMAELNEQLRTMDVILTGYPTRDHEITRFQISSKIGDALAVGKPVMVPRGPSTDDLEGTRGIFLFDETSFAEALAKALVAEPGIRLPHAFSLEGAYEAFAAAEKKAGAAPRALKALDLLPGNPDAGHAVEPALLLIWKQHDAGLYGRRIDQIARAYKKAFPDRRVIILELLHDATFKGRQAKAGDYLAEDGSLLRAAQQKMSTGFDDAGVCIKQILFSSSARLSEQVDRFLIANDLLPTNTTVVLFPLIRFFERLAPSFRSYRKVVDVVDNQFSWGSGDSSAAKRVQYASLFLEADRVVFNSDRNAQFFAEQNLLGDVPVSVIKNWYSPPPEHRVRTRKRTGRRILYSGNMKDRIDWSLLYKVAGLERGVELHLAGTANVSTPEIAALLDLENVILHGPLEERETLSLLDSIDVAIVPHKCDPVSNFMNPLKVHMYIAAGVPVVATDVPGIDEHPLLVKAGDHGDFLDAVRRALNDRSAKTAGRQDLVPARAYNRMLETLRKAERR